MAKVSRAQMPNLINYSLNMLSALDIQEAFRLTGIHPIDPSIINCLKQTLSKESDKNDENNPNCLVDMGIVPQSLADILVPPPVKPSKGKRKVTGARLTATEPVPCTSTNPLLSTTSACEKNQESEWPFNDSEPIIYD